MILYLKGVNKKFFTGLKVCHDDLGFWLESLMMDDAILLLDVLLSCDEFICYGLDIFCGWYCSFL